MTWLSPVGDARALLSLSGAEWLTRVTGGLLTTCGMSRLILTDEVANVGQEGAGLRE